MNVDAAGNAEQSNYPTVSVYTNYTPLAKQYVDVPITPTKQKALVDLIANPEQNKVVIIQCRYDGYDYRYAIHFNGKSFDVPTPVYVSRGQGDSIATAQNQYVPDIVAPISEEFLKSLYVKYPALKESYIKDVINKYKDQIEQSPEKKEKLKAALMDKDSGVFMWIKGKSLLDENKNIDFPGFPELCDSLDQALSDDFRRKVEDALTVINRKLEKASHPKDDKPEPTPEKVYDIDLHPLNLSILFGDKLSWGISQQYVKKEIDQMFADNPFALVLTFQAQPATFGEFKQKYAEHGSIYSPYAYEVINKYKDQIEQSSEKKEKLKAALMNRRSGIYMWIECKSLIRDRVKASELTEIPEFIKLPETLDEALGDKFKDSVAGALHDETFAATKRVRERMVAATETMAAQNKWIDENGGLFQVFQRTTGFPTPASSSGQRRQ